MRLQTATRESTAHVPLGRVVRFIRGVTFGPNDPVPHGTPESVVCMRTKNIQQTLDESDLLAVPRRVVKRDEQFLRPNDILVSSANSWNLVGKCVPVPGPGLAYRATAGGFISILRADPEQIDASYLYRWLSSDATQEQARSCARQTTNIANLSVDRFLELEVPLPSLSEQRRIAALLDKADAIRRKRQQAIRLADDLLRSAFLDTFGDPVTNPKEWPTLPIAEMAEIVTGNTPPRGRPEYYGNTIEWIKSDNINTPSHILTRAAERLSEPGHALARTAPEGSTLMTCIAGSPRCIGNVALTDRAVAFNQQINAIVPGPSVDPHFLYVELLLSKRVVQDASTDSMKGMVSKSRLSSVRLPSPPPQEQQSFGRWFSRFLRWRSMLDAALAESSALFDCLAQRTFRGEA